MIDKDIEKSNIKIKYFLHGLKNLYKFVIIINFPIRGKLVKKMKKLLIPVAFMALVLSGCNLVGPVTPTSAPTVTTNPTTSVDPSSGDTTSNPTSTSSQSSSSSQTSTTSGVTPTVTSVTLDKTSATLAAGESLTLKATVNGTHSPSQSVAWSTSNSSVATVSSGKVEVKSTATAGQTATITATSVVDTSKKATCTVTVQATTDKAAYTLMLYICGSTLEYDNGVVGGASADIAEILSVANQPSNVNILIETGGAKGWENSSIDENYIQRFYVKNKKLNFVENAGSYTSTTNKANMGKSTTLESFLTWGINNYPADKYALVLWNHGGAVSGVCSDEYNLDQYKMGDMLITSEVASALKNTFANTSASKLEWIGYDACIMNYLDNASVMADYCNYLIGSQELEEGDGWDYTAWLPTLYSSPTGTTATLLNKICKTFVDQYGTKQNYQCLSVLDLSKMSTFTTEFNKYTKNFTTSSHFDSIVSAFSNSLQFGESIYGLADFSSFIAQMEKKFTSISATALKNAYEALVEYTYCGSVYTTKKPSGSDIFVAYSDDYYYGLQPESEDYGTNDTKFTYWRDINIKYGF